MGCLYSGMFRNSVVFSLAISASALANGGDARIIFAAENALYGSGYDIGKADGWMDNTLRAAISRFQGQSQRLTSTGVLDAQTLKALGVSVPPSTSISGNDVASPALAQAELGFSKASKKSPATTSPSVKPAKQPEVEPKKKDLVAKPRPAPVAETVATPEVKAAPALTSRKPDAPKPQKVAKAQQKPTVTPPPEPKPIVAKPEMSKPSQPEQDVKQVSTVEAAEPTPASQKSVSVASRSRYELKADGTQSSLEKLGAITGNPVAPATNESPQAQRASEDGDAQLADEQGESSTDNPGISGFFSNLFDFLFGWIV
ncbi:peptidoglycan-binding protein [Marinobacter sp. chi1]|uniref:Peptidoglycan-binding protein n=1 Tax=Marinobacter suaedae TaxID=3057675 RepID=A0ABT8W1L5_9GAMM|nr:peptidoglycan-binding protein [Marinobacter sp. chi1]MDO3722115.1 peptidoglycan-binding protein [Marinobacter sp. chi1]